MIRVICSNRKRKKEKELAPNLHLEDLDDLSGSKWLLNNNTALLLLSSRSASLG